MARRRERVRRTPPWWEEVSGRHGAETTPLHVRGSHSCRRRKRRSRRGSVLLEGCGATKFDHERREALTDTQGTGTGTLAHCRRVTETRVFAKPELIERGLDTHTLCPTV